jgi:XTP/dITP diphosphohydrolase
MLVLGTSNPGKAREFADLLHGLPLRLVTLAELAAPLGVEENGATLAENALGKATALARQVGQWVLADDTGLEVESLGGAPGVHTARYAGPAADAAANRARLLRELEGVPDERRQARFVCHLVLADGSGHVRATACGCCRGRIRHTPAGSRGFGYDALFELPEYRLTLAELGPVALALLGHRGRAVAELRSALSCLLLAGPEGRLEPA